MYISRKTIRNRWDKLRVVKTKHTSERWAECSAEWELTGVDSNIVFCGFLLTIASAESARTCPLHRCVLILVLVENIDANILLGKTIIHRVGVVVKFFSVRTLSVRGSIHFVLQLRVLRSYIVGNEWRSYWAAEICCPSPHRRSKDYARRVRRRALWGRHPARPGVRPAGGDRRPQHRKNAVHRGRDQGHLRLETGVECDVR